MFAEIGTTMRKTTRRGLALTLGTVNLAGEAVTQPRKWMRSAERRGERMLRRFGTANRSIGARVNVGTSTGGARATASRSTAAERKRRSAAARKAARTRKANQALSGFEKTTRRAERGLERVADRIGDAAEALTR